MLEEAKTHLSKALPFAEIDIETWEMLQFPQRTLQCSIPMRADDGTLRIYKAFRSQYDGSLGMGGAKGSICCDSTKLSHRELERLCRSYVDAFYNFLGGENIIDVPAPDLYTDSRCMAWMYSQYKKISGKHSPEFITGKPVALGGLDARVPATGGGGGLVLTWFLNNYNKLSGKNIFNKKPTIAIQGFGQVGSYFHQYCENTGFKVVAVSNEHGGIYNPDGVSYTISRKNISESDGHYWGEQGQSITNGELLRLDVDIIVPAAIESVINKDNMHDIKAKIILELANNPTTLEADEYLNEKGVLIMPDILCNAGGVIVSYWEWLQNKSGDIRIQDRVEYELKNMLWTAASKIVDISLDKGINLRTAAFVCALNRIGAVQQCLGTKKYFAK